MIQRIELFPADIDRLVAPSMAEGHRFVARLRDAWVAGQNRFDLVGEALFEARDQGQLVGICGLNRDPYLEEAAVEDPILGVEAVGRVRHLYVLPTARRRRIGAALVEAVVDHASDWFRRLRLRTDSVDADRFYVSLGFRRVRDETHVTHELLERT